MHTQGRIKCLTAHGQSDGRGLLIYMLVLVVGNALFSFKNSVYGC
jgi:hypothetical protein